MLRKDSQSEVGSVQSAGILARIRNRYKTHRKDISGQSTIEYILILAIVVMLASNLKKSISQKVEGSLNKIDQELNQW